MGIALPRRFGGGSRRCGVFSRGLVVARILHYVAGRTTASGIVPRCDAVAYGLRMRLAAPRGIGRARFVLMREAPRRTALVPWKSKQCTVLQPGFRAVNA